MGELCQKINLMPRNEQISKPKPKLIKDTNYKWQSSLKTKRIGKEPLAPRVAGKGRGLSNIIFQAYNQWVTVENLMRIFTKNSLENNNNPKDTIL